MISRHLLHVIYSTLFTALAVAGCTSAEEQARDAERATALKRLDQARVFADSIRRFDSLRVVEAQTAEEAFPVINYKRLYVADRGTLDSVRKAFDYSGMKSAAYRVFTTLNRRAFYSVRVGDTVVVPDRIVEDLRAYSVFPQRYFEADTLAKIVVISNEYQAYACYENGKLVRFAACNTGRQSKPTLPGRYAMNWRERHRTSSLNENWKLPFNINFHLFAGNAFHQFDMPGRPVSHSCVRQFKEDAEWLFEWGTMGKLNENGRVIRFTGTPVIIIDMFDYDRPKYGPWLDLASNRDRKISLPDAPMGIEEAWIPMSQIPPSVRGGLPDRWRYKAAEDTLRARGVLKEDWWLSPSIEYPKKKPA